MTPQRFRLYGLWYGPYSAKATKGRPKRPKRAIIFLHGLSSSVFGGVARTIMPLCAEEKTAVLVFNNRGHDVVSRVSGKKRSIMAGSAHEVFTDCVDDIRGAVLCAKKQGAKEIYLVGHSTGCQKAVYYASKMGARAGIAGIVLLAPVSDYAGALKRHGKKKLLAATRIARNFMQAGKRHELLPTNVWPEERDDAQRFLSLYTPDSAEEIFCYAQKEKNPTALRRVRQPILTLWAGKDEYADRPAKKIVEWFRRHTLGASRVEIVPKVSHGFRGAEKKVVAAIRRTMNV